EASLLDTAEFVQRRLEGVLRDEYRLPHDIVQAVLAERGHNPWLALSSARDLTAAIQRDDWEETLNAYARCVRIVRTGDQLYPLQPTTLTEPVERDLYVAYEKVRASLSPASSTAAVIEALRELLVGPINAFFEGVLVMAEDESVRRNRLALLQGIRGLTKGHADFSHLQGF
nr:DALR anticodon-binding domain-containing protein [Anaerolineae bacterium]